MSGKDKKYRDEVREDDSWKSFVDIFATICLTFFFIMIVLFLINSVEKQDAYEKEQEYLRNVAEFMKREEEFQDRELEFNENEESFLDEKTEFLMKERIYQENLAALEAEKEEYEKALAALNVEKSEYEENLDNMRVAQQAYQDIAERRLALYQDMETSLKEVLGDTVRFDLENAKLYLDSEVFFESNESTLLPEYIPAIQEVKRVLFEMIDKYGKDKSGGEASEEEEERSDVKIDFFEIRGHTDLRGSGSYNRGLSTARANAFINEILPDDSAEEEKYAAYFLPSGASKFDPAEGTVHEQSSDQMRANRRVEIVIRFDDKDIEKAISEIAKTLEE